MWRSVAVSLPIAGSSLHPDRETFNGYTLTYDNVGHLTYKAKTGFDQSYYWNSIGQLDSVVTNGGKVSFLYEGQGAASQRSPASVCATDVTPAT